MAQKSKLWLSGLPYDEEYANYLLNQHTKDEYKKINTNSVLHEKMKTKSEFNQIFHIAKGLKRFLIDHPDVKFEDFWVSDNGTYYLSIFMDSETKRHYIWEKPYEIECFFGMKPLHNSPKTCHNKASLRKKFEELRAKYEIYAEITDEELLEKWIIRNETDKEHFAQFIPENQMITEEEIAMQTMTLERAMRSLCNMSLRNILKDAKKGEIIDKKEFEKQFGTETINFLRYIN